MLVQAVVEAREKYQQKLYNPRRMRLTNLESSA